MDDERQFQYGYYAIVTADPDEFAHRLAHSLEDLEADGDERVHLATHALFDPDRNLVQVAQVVTRRVVRPLSEPPSNAAG